MPSMRCSRRPSAAGAATTHAGRMPRPWCAATRRSIAARREGRRPSRHLPAHWDGPSSRSIPPVAQRDRGRRRASTRASASDARCASGACPVDAIIGARKWMHAVLDSECTGCGLCVEPCPVDCISMAPARAGPATAEAWLAQRASLARRRFERRRARESALDAAPHRREQARRIDAAESLRTRTVEQRRADIAAAVARVAARRAGAKAWDAESRR